MPRIGERTRHFTESVIRRMTRVANSVGAINLSQGFPDFGPPLELMRAARPGKAGRTSTPSHGAHRHSARLSPGPTATRVPATAEGPGALQPVVPVRQGVHPRGAGADRPAGPGERLLRHHRRGVRAHRLCPPRAHLFRRAPGDVRPCTLVQLPVEDLLEYRVADRARDRKRGSDAGRRKAHDFLTVGAAAPLQEAAVSALELPESYYRHLLRGHTERRDVFLEQLSASGLTFTTPQGAYCVMVDISEFGAPDDTSFCEWMTREVGVAAKPGSSFFNEPVQTRIWFHFAKKVGTLVEAGKRLRKIRDAWAVRGSR
jgi:hypothetical protein